VDTLIDALLQAARLLLSGDLAVFDVILLSFRVSGSALLFSILLGIPAGSALALARFPGRNLVVALVYTGFALPPVVVGLFVHMVLSRSGPLGALELLFTPTAMVIAQTLLATPYVTGISLAAVQAVPPDMRLQASALGAAPLRALWMHVREARLGLVAAAVAGFGAVISEVGAVMLVGGNLRGQTRVMTTAILLEARQGDYAAALVFGLILLLLAFAVNLILTRLQQGRPGASWTTAAPRWG
jgi:tungstate transport system permease protein